jgi:hypothetical protein
MKGKSWRFSAASVLGISFDLFRCGLWEGGNGASYTMFLRWLCISVFQSFFFSSIFDGIPVLWQFVFFPAESELMS